MASNYLADFSFTVMFILSVYVAFTETSNIQVRRFVPSAICGTLQDLIDNDCTTPTRTRSSIECAITCNKNTSCLGSMLDGNNTCRHLHICDYAWDNMNCQSSHPERVLFPRKECQNGGVFTRSKTTVCKCKNGWIGALCDRKATRCEDMSSTYGYKTGDKYFAPLNTGPYLLKIMCRNKPSETMVGLLCNNGKYNRSLSWWEYKHGYFIDWQNYWVGLENMHRFSDTNKTNVVKWLLYYRNKRSDGSLYETSDTIYYYNFRVLGESHGFSYHFDRLYHLQKTPMMDCLNDTQGVPFSTWDKDKDLDPGTNCAQKTSTGWWFKSCSPSTECNPLGMSVKTLPPPALPAHIALKGLDMINSNSGKHLRRLEMRLFTPLT